MGGCLSTVWSEVGFHWTKRWNRHRIEPRIPAVMWLDGAVSQQRYALRSGLCQLAGRRTRKRRTTVRGGRRATGLDRLGDQFHEQRTRLLTPSRKLSRI